jgi:hypothetical protein
MARIAANIRWGLRGGLWVAAVLSGYVVMLYVARGSAPFVANSTTLPQVLLLYAAGGLAGGILVGLLRPLTRWRAGAVFTGVLTAALVYDGAIRAVTGSWVDFRSSVDLVGFAIMSICGGGIAGYLSWTWTHTRSPQARSRRA